MRIQRVPVYAHWSVVVLAIVILFGAIEQPAVTLGAWTAYFGLLLIHEYGHMIIARRRRCDVFSIELYPILGLVRYSEPWSRYDDALIAWGGIGAQMVLAAPLIVWVSIFGFTRFDSVNVVIGILGYYSVVIAIFNLLPVAPFDGAKAWSVFPELVKRVRGREEKPKRVVGWRGW
jgi:stage IV sporulation protein FB